MTGHRVHFVLQGKGGIGKTLVASMIAQYLSENGRKTLCLDTDPVNGSLQGFKALNAEPVKLLNGDAINVREVDQLVERILIEDAEIVVDNGAASFLPLSSYLIENQIADLIEGAGKEMVVHAILVGAGNALDTAKGLDAVLSHFPPSVKVVVWVNEFFGSVEVNGTRFEDTGLYAQHKGRIGGIVTLPAQNPLTFGANLNEMLSARLTFAEALSSPDWMTVPKQRLTLYRRQVWDQLAQVL